MTDLIQYLLPYGIERLRLSSTEPRAWMTIFDLWQTQEGAVIDLPLQIRVGAVLWRMAAP
jgi:hypothetical protein